MEDPVWGRAVGHPVRGKILRLMDAQGPLSPVRAVGQFEGISLGTLSYHFRLLARRGLIEECDRVQRRGATEHVYRLTQATR